MKNKLLSVLTGLLLGIAAVAGSAAPAGTKVVSEADEAASCADWSFHDSRCVAYLTPSTGKAAYGEPTAGMGRAEEVPLSCEDWSFNDSRCPAYLTRMAGKSAYGEPSGTMRQTETEIPLSCEDWSFQDTRCPAHIRQ